MSGSREGDGRESGVLRVLVTAGPTHEPIDAVRFIGNRSSGAMGAAIADEARARGFEVTVYLGPCAIGPVDTGVVVERFRTAADLETLLRRGLAGGGDGFDVVVMAAAVADYRPARMSGGKLRRSEGGLSIELEATPDLLAGVSEMLAGVGEGRPYLVGFALEPREGLEAAARAKLERKGVDAVVGNPLETMESGEVDGVLVLGGGVVEVAPAGVSKREFAVWLWDRLADRVEAARRGGPGS